MSNAKPSPDPALSYYSWSVFNRVLIVIFVAVGSILLLIRFTSIAEGIFEAVTTFTTVLVG
jgi:hypothetical protein